MSKCLQAAKSAQVLTLLGTLFVLASPGARDAVAAKAKPSDFSRRTAVGSSSAAGIDATTTTTITNLPVCTASLEQYVPAMIQVGGGAIAVWDDYRNGQRDLYAQKITAGGVTEWVADGVPVCKAANHQRDPQAVPDGAGGAIVVWQDARSDTASDIYAQRIDVDGVAMWTTEGVPVCVMANAQKRPVIVADGQGGAVVAWVDDRSGTSDVYAQRLNAAGVVQWAVNGVALCTATGVQQELAIVTDGQRGAIVAWQDRRSGAGDIYAGRVSESGVAMWGTGGVALCAASGEQEKVAAVADGVGGVMVGWVDQRGASRDIYGQRVDASGTVQWGANGVGVCVVPGEQVGVVVCGDGAGGAVMVWQDERPGGQGLEIYGQRLDGAGVLQWGNGTGVCMAAGDQTAPALAVDPMGGVVVAWSDLRNPGSAADIYAQHVSVGGVAQWTVAGVRLCDATGAQDGARVIADGLGGAAVVWRDFRAGVSCDLYGQHIDAGGQVSNQCVTPGALLSDQPVSTLSTQNYRSFDQTWFYWSGVAVRGDAGSDWDIEVYDQGSFGLNPYPTCFGVPLAGSFGTSTVDFVVGDFNDNQTPPGIYGMRAYRYSGSGGAVMEYDDGPQVIAKDGAGITAPAGWTGPIDVFDVGLNAGATYWFELNHAPAADIKVLLFTSYGSLDYYYVVPRSSRVAESPGRWMVYTAPATDFYGVVIVNDNGVPDGYNLKVWSSTPVGVETPAVRATALGAVAPNPSTGPVRIEYALAEPAEASFEVVDMAGRMVARVAAERREPGRWSVGWEGNTTEGRRAAPGIYFVRMRVNGRSVGHARVALLR